MFENLKQNKVPFSEKVNIGHKIAAVIAPLVTGLTLMSQGAQVLAQPSAKLPDKAPQEQKLFENKENLHILPSVTTADGTQVEILPSPPLREWVMFRTADGSVRIDYPKQRNAGKTDSRPITVHYTTPTGTEIVTIPISLKGGYEVLKIGDKIIKLPTNYIKYQPAAQS